MRNLAKYPLTLDEIVTTLDSMAEQIIAEERVGDMRPMILIEAASLLSAEQPLSPITALAARARAFPTKEAGPAEHELAKACREALERDLGGHYEARVVLYRHNGGRS